MDIPAIVSATVMSYGHHFIELFAYIVEAAVWDNSISVW